MGETLPLLTPDEEEGESQGPEKVLAGPWDLKDVNPFCNSSWTPLRATFQPQEKLEVPHVDVSISVPNLINQEHLFEVKQTHGLFGEKESPIPEPSQL